MSLPNTDGYTLITPEELLELDEAGNKDVVRLTKAIHHPSFVPALLLDLDDGRKLFITMETAQKAKALRAAS